MPMAFDSNRVWTWVYLPADQALLFYMWQHGSEL